MLRGSDTLKGTNCRLKKLGVLSIKSRRSINFKIIESRVRFSRGRNIFLSNSTILFFKFSDVLNDVLLAREMGRNLLVSCLI